MANDLTLTLTQQVEAAPERVFDAWLDPATLKRFMCPGPDMSVPRAETDPRVGGRYDIVMAAGESEIPHWGEYRELDRPNRLVFTWNSPHSAPDSLVTLTFAAAGDGTEVTLMHERFVSEEMRGNHEKGWGAILATLAGVSEDA